QPYIRPPFINPARPTWKRSGVNPPGLGSMTVEPFDLGHLERRCPALVDPQCPLHSPGPPDGSLRIPGPNDVVGGRRSGEVHPVGECAHGSVLLGEGDSAPPFLHASEQAVQDSVGEVGLLPVGKSCLRMAAGFSERLAVWRAVGAWPARAWCDENRNPAGG